MARYEPRGAALELFYDRTPELVISGPAGTGKSLAILHKVLLCAEKYAGMRALVCRKTRASLTQSAMVTWEKEVLPRGHRALRGASRASRAFYTFPNGSEVVLGGLDKDEKILSTQYDLIYPQECIELELDDWETLVSRLRNYVMPYQQIVGCTNPGPATHWVKRRCDDGLARMLLANHTDNPAYWDGDAGQWTERGAQYIASLDRLTGSRKERLRWGRWVAMEGLVYDGFSERRHVLDGGDAPEGTWFWTADFGFSHPAVVQLWCWTGEELVLWREHYRSGALISDMADRMFSETGVRPTAVVTDHSARERALLERSTGITCTLATKTVLEGIQRVAEYLADGRLKINRGALLEPDASLSAKGRPTCTLEELPLYRWDSKAPKDRPVKEHDHGCDAMRYAVAYVDQHLAPQRRLVSSRRGGGWM